MGIFIEKTNVDKETKTTSHLINAFIKVNIFRFTEKTKMYILTKTIFDLNNIK